MRDASPPCSVCDEPSVASRLCDKHYRRFRRNGRLDLKRPDDWGQRHKHPLWQSWKWTKRTGRDSRWNEFWNFVADVGDRPTEKSTLRRRNTDRPCGPENWYWMEPVAEEGVGNNSKAARASYARAWRAKNPLLAKEGDLKKRGLTLAEYEAMLAKQRGGCAICGQRDQWFNLAVDHCHSTKRIRGLLCSQCNRGLGLFRDNPDFLEKAAGYLRWPTRLL